MKKLILSAVLGAMTFGAAQAQEIKPFKDGDRVVFLGNSITDGGLYHSYIWLYYMTRYPEMNLKVFNGGIGGDTAFDMNKRLDNDIFSKDPSVLVVTFGMNDSGYFEYNGDNAKEFGEQKYQESIGNFNNMVKRFEGLPETRMVMVGTSPYDNDAKIEGNNFKDKNKTIQRIVDYQMATADKHGWEHIDWNRPMVEINNRFQQADSSFTLCGTDRIHPDNHGHMVMAYLFLKAQGMAGNKVADIEINGSKGKLVKEENCTVTDLVKKGSTISFDYLAKSLPYPVDTIAQSWGMSHPQAEALKIVPFVEEMNQEILKVTGLKGDYRLFIDGEEMGSWSAAELAEGVNLAEVIWTPQYQQALAVMHLNNRRWELEREFRYYAWCQHGFFQQLGLLNANNRHAVEVMDKNIAGNGWMQGRRPLYAAMMHKEVRDGMQSALDALTNTIYSINKPVVHHFELQKL